MFYICVSRGRGETILGLGSGGGLGYMRGGVDGKSRSVVSRFALVDAFLKETGV